MTNYAAIEKTRKIIAENIYITIATATIDGIPWISPLFAAHDKNYTFYWVSPKNALHSRLIQKNCRIAIVIFDSHASEGAGEGIYIQARAYEVNNEKEIEQGARLIYGAREKTARPTTHFMGASPRRIYKAIPEKFWINVGEEVNGYYSDSRIEVFPLSQK